MQAEEAKKMIDVLQSAIQMEVEGKEFYQQASQKSSNKLAKELFQKLANEQDIHCKKFEEIYEALRKGQDWPDCIAPEANKAPFLGKSGSIKPWLPRSEDITLPSSTPMNT